MISGAILIVLHQYGPKIFRSKLCHFWSSQNFTNFQTNPEWVGFAPKTRPNDLCSNSYLSPSVRPKNIPVKTLSLLVFPKLPKLSNQARTGWFCPQNPLYDFWSSSYHSPSLWPKNISVKTLSLLVFLKLLKLSTKPIMVGFAPRTRPNDLWSSSYYSS